MRSRLPYRLFVIFLVALHGECQSVVNISKYDVDDSTATNVSLAIPLPAGKTSEDVEARTCFVIAICRKDIILDTCKFNKNTVP